MLRSFEQRNEKKKEVFRTGVPVRLVKGPKHVLEGQSHREQRWGKRVYGMLLV
jgi:hypothetical protein